MYSFVKNIFCIALVLLASSSANAWVMDAEGFGDTPENAKLAAYATLAAQIRSEIKSDISSNVVVHNDKVDNAAAIKNSQSSNMILKGVTYGPVSKRDAGYRTVATFDQDALDQTSAYYESETRFDVLGISSSRAFELKSLLLMWQSVNLVDTDAGKKSKYSGLINERLRLVNARIENGILKVHTDAANATIKVDGKSAAVDEMVVLNDGNHLIEILAPKYKTLSKSVYVGKGSVVKLSEMLIPATDQRQLVLKIGADFREFLDEKTISELMADYGWEQSQDSRYSLDIAGTLIMREAGEFINCEFNFNIGVFDGQARLKSVTFQRKIPAKRATLVKDVTQKLQPDIKQALTALANSITWPQ